MARPCTCVRCKAEVFVHGIYPKMDDRRVLAVATDIVRALRSSVEESWLVCVNTAPDLDHRPHPHGEPNKPHTRRIGSG